MYSFFSNSIFLSRVINYVEVSSEFCLQLLNECGENHHRLSVEQIVCYLISRLFSVKGFTCVLLYTLTISAYFSGNIINNIPSNDLSNPKCSCVILEQVVNDSQATGHPSYG